MPPTFIIGDIHGHYKPLTQLLRFDGQIIDKDLRWNAGDATLCFMGDYFDRGPDGVSVVRLIMRLQREAEMVGGRVIALLGNHEVALLGARRFSKKNKSSPFFSAWVMMDGQLNDFADLNEAQAHWLQQRPIMYRIAGRLLVHADALFYRRYGETVNVVNRFIQSILQSNNLRQWDTLMDNFSERYAFSPYDWYGDTQLGGVVNAQALLKLYDAKQIIHGHTPIFRMTGQTPQTVNTPLIYADGLAVNVDHGMYKGGSGFIYELPPSIN